MVPNKLAYILSASEPIHLVWHSVLSILSQMSKILMFYWRLNSIASCRCSTFFCIYAFMNMQIGAFCLFLLLWIRPQGARECSCLFVVLPWYLLDMLPKVGHLAVNSCIFRFLLIAVFRHGCINLHSEAQCINSSPFSTSSPHQHFSDLGAVTSSWWVVMYLFYLHVSHWLFVFLLKNVCSDLLCIA